LFLTDSGSSLLATFLVVIIKFCVSSVSESIRESGVNSTWAIKDLISIFRDSFNSFNLLIGNDKSRELKSLFS